MDMFEDFRGFEHLYDANLRTEDGKEFPFHRVLLAMRSTYLHKILCSAPMEQTDIFIPGIQGSTMEIIMEYIYTGKLNFTENNIKDILMAADFLGIEKLSNSSRYLAIANLTITNSVALLDEGVKDEHLGVSKASHRFIEVNFERILRDQSSGFEDLTAESFERLLSSDSLNVSNESQVWKAIEVWIGKCPEERKQYLKNLIPYIRFNDASSDLSSEVLNHPIVKENSSHIELLEFLSNQSRVPKCRTPKLFYFFTKTFINRSDYAQGVKIFITYDENIDIWRNITSKIICPDIVLHGSGPLVVMFETAGNVIYTYDILTKTWSTLNEMNIPRYKFSLVKLRNHIYAVGGYTLDREEDETVTTLERYSFDSERWEILAPHDSITEGAAAVVDNKIYFIGISDFFDEFLIAQVYDPNTDIWQTVSAPKVYRYLFALAVYKEQLFILGGQNNEECLTSVEVYDAHRDTWKEFEKLPFSYFLPKAVIIKEVLYVYDIHSDEMIDYRCPPVYWDQKYRKWQVVEASSPFCDLYLYQFCTIDDPEVLRKIRQDNRDPGTEWAESPFFIYLNS